VSDPELLFLHRALLDRDPVAPRRLANACLERLYRILRKTFPLLSEETLRDAASDALLALILHPNRYDPKQSSLLNYLTHIAQNYAYCALRKSQRQQQRVTFVGGLVELDQAAANNPWQIGEADPLTDPDTLPPEVEALLHETLPAPQDRHIWNLICEGRVDYAEYAAILGITHLPLAEQKRAVKRHRDRVQKRVLRQKERFRRLLQCDPEE
jgi:RNA polymerase sigma-70 factor (ECF subfamily)